MTTHRIARGTTTYGLVVAAALALGAIGAVGAHGLAVESGEAGAFVSLGETALAGGDKASAALSLERARLLAPRADFVRSALEGAGLGAPAPPMARAASWLTAHEWSFLTLVFGWTTGLSVAAGIALGPRWKRGRLAGLLGLGSGLAFVLSMGGVVQTNAASRALAVVMRPTGTLVAPYEAAGATADLRAGQIVVVGERYGEFVQVRGAPGVDGWVGSSTLESVVGAGG